ncbi:MAG: hemin uptake protein HemP [Trichlorobacter sp.]|nr:hemin uptake protein HemP [Trichlorobacter sp.]MDK9719097.1 hemin uptake protein HemP [Trichlorobacter sp.]
MEKRTITSEKLFGDLQEIIIQHAGESYHLRITSNNKLILTK